MLTIVVGAQYGGEGKGKVSAYLSTQTAFSVVCRCGGVNSKHSVFTDGREFHLRVIPAACAAGYKGDIVYGAGFLMHVPTLFEEMELLAVDPKRIHIDSQTGIVTQDIIEAQRKDARYKNIGSTLTGTGYAMAERVLRKLPLARDDRTLSEMVGDSADLLDARIKNGEDILIEGHQSAGLSNYHGDYPYTSSRDATASALLSELGIGPRVPSRIVLVAKVFPTRNHAGTLPNELTTGDAQALGIEEYGGGSWGIASNRRRVGRFDTQQVKRAVLLNSASEIALTGVDYLDPSAKNVVEFNQFSEKVKSLVHEIETECAIPVTFLSVGPETGAMVKR